MMKVVILCSLVTALILMPSFIVLSDLLKPTVLLAISIFLDLSLQLSATILILIIVNLTQTRTQSPLTSVTIVTITLASLLKNKKVLCLYMSSLWKTWAYCS